MSTSKLVALATVTVALLASSLLAPAPAEAGKRVVVLRTGPVQAGVVVRTPVKKRVWVPGHWKAVGPRRAVWVPGHWTRR